ncbi:Uncharacterised protein [Candidatus Gugararchaeum adminiculabundum]|nr:Uncharacterised protein [Candidatus Gugararchaeum adminiculabundum]
MGEIVEANFGAKRRSGQLDYAMARRAFFRSSILEGRPSGLELGMVRRLACLEKDSETKINEEFATGNKKPKEIMEANGLDPLRAARVSEISLFEKYAKSFLDVPKRGESALESLINAFDSSSPHCEDIFSSAKETLELLDRIRWGRGETHDILYFILLENLEFFKNMQSDSFVKIHALALDNGFDGFITSELEVSAVSPFFLLTGTETKTLFARTVAHVFEAFEFLERNDPAFLAIAINSHFMERGSRLEAALNETAILTEEEVHTLWFDRMESGLKGRWRENGVLKDSPMARMIAAAEAFETFIVKIEKGELGTYSADMEEVVETYRWLPPASFESIAEAVGNMLERVGKAMQNWS